MPIKIISRESTTASVLVLIPKIVLPKVKSETGKKAFAFQGPNICNKLTDEMKTETSILLFKTFCKIFNFDF